MLVNFVKSEVGYKFRRRTTYKYQDKKTKKSNKRNAHKLPSHKTPRPHHLLKPAKIHFIYTFGSRVQLAFYEP
jgi:hypothetical protein